MTDTTATAGLTPQVWDDKYFSEYFQENRFAGEMGTSENSIIQVKQDLTKKKGDAITFALVNRLTGAGVTGNTKLVGSEEELSSRSYKLTVTQRRNAVVVSDYDEQLSAIPLRDAAKVALMDWSQENTRDRIIGAMGDINGVAYGTASEAQKDAWLVDNADRCLFGAAKSNNAVNDHSAALLQIDNTADKLTAAVAKLAKRMATSASPKIRPVRSASSGKRWYTMYCNTESFRDLSEDPVIVSAQKDTISKMHNESLFEAGDIVYGGIIFKEVDDLPVLAGVGAGGIQVGANYLCGAQAIGYGIAKRWETRTDDTDYGDKQGCAVREFGNFGKMVFGSGATDTDDLKDHGIVTVFTAAVADA